MSSLKPPTIHKGAGAGREQVALKPGHSLMDWIKLKNKRGRGLAGPRQADPAPITKEELAKHKVLLCSLKRRRMPRPQRVLSHSTHLQHTFNTPSLAHTFNPPPFLQGPEGEIWMAVRGYVYNVTPYMDFHPGGRGKLMAGAVREMSQQQRPVGGVGGSVGCF